MPRTTLPLAALALLPLLALACASPEPPPVVATAVAPLVNGDLEFGFDSVVSVGGEINDTRFSMCSANLVAPRVLLTAGHCGDQIPIELVVALGEAYFGHDIEDPDIRIGFVDMHVHPDYVELQNGPGGTLGEFDLNVLELAEDAPFRPTRFRVAPLDDADDVGGEVTSVGFGVTGPDGAGSGVKRSAVLVVDDIDEMFVLSQTSTNPDQATVCSGDSGGPQFALVDGEPVQWAVHSWSDVDCAIRSGSTRVDVAADWLLDHIEDVHGSRDPCEFNGWYGDGSCDAFCAEEDPDCVEPEPIDADDDDGGCQCRSAGATGASVSPAVAASLALLVAVRRRRSNGRAR